MKSRVCGLDSQCIEDGNFGIGKVRISVLRDHLELLRELAEFSAVILGKTCEVVVDSVDLRELDELPEIDDCAERLVLRLLIYFGVHTCAHMNLWNRFTWNFEVSKESVENITWISNGSSRRTSGILSLGVIFTVRPRRFHIASTLLSPIL